MPVRRPHLAVNVGGAVVPVLICLYVLAHQLSAILPSAIGVAVVGLVVHRWARPVRGLGIAIPMFIPPIVAALAAWFLAVLFGGPQHIDAIAYVSGVLGTLIGADLANLGNLGDLGAPVGVDRWRGHVRRRLPHRDRRGPARLAEQAVGDGENLAIRSLKAGNSCALGEL